MLPFMSLMLDVPFWYSIFIMIPIQSFIISVTFNSTPCPLTKAENALRKQLGLKPIGGFIGHYLLRKKRDDHARQL